MTDAGAVTSAVVAWLESLDADQRARATFPFETDSRFAWDYTPVTHDGLALADMSDTQRRAAMAILDASLGGRGTVDTRAVIELETTLGEIERTAGRANWRRRDPERYWFAVFGDPSGPDGAAWSWRVNGHHVCAHVTVRGDAIIASMPSFLGSNPAIVPSGSRAGHRALTGEETLARALLAGLTADQRAIAVIDPVAPPDILSGHGRIARLDGIEGGIGWGALDASGQRSLEALIRHYLGRARDEVAASAWDRIANAGLDTVTFAWAGPDEPGTGHYYAVRGPTILLEYDNTQNGANHIHAVWRDLERDWGGDVLATHYRASHV